MVITTYPSIKNNKYIFEGEYENEGIVYLFTIILYNSSYQSKSYIVHFSLFIIHCDFVGLYIVISYVFSSFTFIIIYQMFFYF